MSLIFKALQRVRQSDKAPGKERVKIAAQNPVRRLGNILGSPLVALGASTAIFLSGVLVSHAVNLFSLRGKRLTSTVEAAQSSPQMVLSAEQGANSSAMAPTQSPGDAQEVAYQVHMPGAVLKQPVGLPCPKGPVQFYPAESQSMHQPAEPANEKALSLEAGMFGIPGHHDSNATAILPPEFHSTSIETAALGNRVAVSSWLSREKVPSSISTESDSATAAATSNSRAEKAVKGFPGINHRRQSTQATLHRKVFRLTRNVLSAIQAGDAALATDLIQQLVRIKGSQNYFVLNIKAYALISQGRLDEARSLLSRVLAHSANDFEAGLNMAVIDIKSNRYDLARRRLTHLQDLYPEKSSIGRYLRQLPR